MGIEVFAEDIFHYISNLKIHRPLNYKTPVILLIFTSLIFTFIVNISRADINFNYLFLINSKKRVTVCFMLASISIITFDYILKNVNLYQDS